MNIAIVGLGRIGTSFINKIMNYKNKGVHIIVAAEENETEGKKIALSKGIQIKSCDEITSMGNYIDIIFDLTGNEDVRKSLRSGLQKNKNTHTTVAPETFTYLLWSIMEDQPLPNIHSNKGY